MSYILDDGNMIFLFPEDLIVPLQPISTISTENFKISRFQIHQASLVIAFLGDDIFILKNRAGNMERFHRVPYDGWVAPEQESEQPKISEKMDRFKKLRKGE